MAEESAAATADAQEAESRSTTEPLEADAGAPTDGDGDENDDQVTAEQARKLRSEHKSLRQRLKQAEKERDDLKRASMSDQDRREAEVADLRGRAGTLETEARTLRAQLAATRVGIPADLADVAAAAVDWDAIDDPSDAKQVERALRAVVKDRPSLAGGDRQTWGAGEGLQGTGSRRPGASSDMNDLIRNAAGRTPMVRR